MAPGTDVKMKPFTCMECSKSYPNKTQLMSHERVHNDAKPHECSDCSKSFKHKYTLILHKRRIHNGENVTFVKNLSKPR